MNLNKYDNNLVGKWEAIEFNLEMNSESIFKNQLGTFVSKSRLKLLQAIHEEDSIESVLLELEHKCSHDSQSLEACIKIPTMGIEWNRVQENSFKGKLSLIFYGVEIVQRDKESWQINVSEIRVCWNENEEVLCGLNYSVNTFCGPASLPLIGSFPTLDSECHVLPFPVLGFCHFTEGVEGEIQCTTTGGWRTKDIHGWKEFPIQPYESTPMIESISCGRTVIKSLCKMSYQESWLEDYALEYNASGCKAEVPELFSRKKIVRSYENKGGEITLVPALKKSVHRLNDNYKAVIKRGRFPRCIFRSETVKGKTFFDRETPFLGTVNPIQNSLEEEVFSGCPAKEKNIDHLITDFEKPFEWASYAPIKSWDRKWTVVDMEVQNIRMGCYFLESSQNASEPADLEFSDQRWIEEHYHSIEFPVIEKEEKKEYSPNLWHKDSILTYINTVVHPHWNYSLVRTKDSELGMQFTGTGWTLNPQMFDDSDQIRWGWNKVRLFPFEMAATFQSSKKELWSLKQGQTVFYEDGIHVSF